MKTKKIIQKQIQNGSLYKWTTELIKKKRLAELTQIPLNKMDTNHRSLISDLAWAEIKRQKEGGK